jgi:hypothetical protein
MLGNRKFHLLHKERRTGRWEERGKEKIGKSKWRRKNRKVFSSGMKGA